MGTRADNLSSLRKWAENLRRRAAVDAVEAGQEVMAAGMARRCALPRVARSIVARPVGVGRDFVGGFVVAEDRQAAPLEARRPFVGPTARGDEPRAVRAMLGTLGRMI